VITLTFTLAPRRGSACDEAMTVLVHIHSVAIA